MILALIGVELCAIVVFVIALSHDYIHTRRELRKLYKK